VAPKAATARTESVMPAGVGSPIMDAPLEEDSVGDCPGKDDRDSEYDGPRSSACKGLAGKGVCT
jgi:hypothetical protein